MRILTWILGLFLCAMFSACSAPAPSESSRLSRASLTQDWESGVNGWTDRNGQPPTLVTDTSSTSGQTVQQINRGAAGGDYVSPLLDVVGGQSYCIRAKIKWVSGAAPFVGVEQYVDGVTQGVNWLIGTGYTDPRGSTTIVSSSDTGWQEFAETLSMSANTTQVRLVDELYQGGSKGGDPLAFFDGIAFDPGSCAPGTSMPYTQDWELGVGNWKDLSGQAPTLVADISSLAGQTVQQINRAAVGGDYFSPWLDVVGGQSYCIRATLKWVSGAAPFVGIEQSVNRVSQGVNWLIGSRYTDPRGSTAVVNSNDSGWQEFGETLIMSANTTRVRLVDELYQGGSRGGDPLAYLDGISIDSGSCTAVTPLPYTQDWESGVGNWKDPNGQAPTVVRDASSLAGPTVQQVNRTSGGGDYFSPLLDVVGGQSYCMRAKIKWLSGAAPFVGIEQYANHVSLGVNWLFGTRYTDVRGSTMVVSSSNTGWQELGKTLVMSANTTQVRLVDELYQAGSKGGNPLAYFDGISLDSGSCTPMPYTQDWESGVGNWKDLSGQAPTLVSDASSPAGETVQQVKRATTGGDYFSPWLEIVSGQSYCIRAKLKWVSGAAPFVGVEQYANGVSQGINWLIGTQYTDPRGSTMAISSSDTGWQELGKTLVMSYNTTQVRLVDELYQGGSKGGDPLAYFDGISIDTGFCSPPYTQNWESGTGSWKDISGQPPTLVTDASSPVGQTVQQVNQATAGSNYFSPWLYVVGGEGYCIRSKIRWVSGAAPFVGIEQYASGASQGVNWLIGTEYADERGSTTVISSSDTNWQGLARTLLLSDNTTQVRLVDKLLESGSKGGDPLAYFDGISIDTGYCWEDPPSVNMSTDKSSYLVGDPVLVTWASPDAIGGRIVLAPAGSDTSAVTTSVKVERALSGSQTFQNVPPGDYEVRFFYGSSSNSVIASSTINIVAGSTDKTSYALGDPIVVNWGNMGASDGRVVIAPVGSDLSVSTAAMSVDLSTPGSHVFTGLPAGDYEVRFLDGSSQLIGTASSAINVYARFAATQPTLVPYDFIVASWRDVAPNAQDWVAIAPEGSSDTTVIDWVYTGGVDGSHAFGPLAAGTYRARYFQSGTNTKLYESEVIQVKTLTPALFNQADVGENYACGVTPEHKVKCWGYNGYGQLGDGTYNDSATPVEVAGISTALSASAGYEHTCAVTSEGKVRCWGANWYGQLGDGTYNDSLTPVEVAGISTATAVSASYFQSCAVTSDGKVRCWGANWYGQLGDGSYSDSVTPVEVTGMSTATVVSTAYYHSCAMTSDGMVRCWGANWNGQLGDGTYSYSGIPVDVAGISTATGLSSGYYHTCAVTSDGKVKCWGYNLYGQLGDGTTTESGTPVEVTGISNAVTVSTGDNHSCAQLSDGTARCWGYNGSGQLGNGTTADAGIPSPVQVVGVTNALGVSVGGSRSCALTSSGSLQCWGDNYYRQPGDGTNCSATEAVVVTNINSIAVGGYHVCASSIDGKVRCWGANWYGQLGDGTNSDRYTPVEVGVASAASVDAGDIHTCTLVNNGTVRCWGANWYGQLGDGTSNDSAIPVEVAGMSNATAVSAGYYHTCAVTSDGRVRCWGDNSYGELGDGTFTSSASPVQVAGITNVTAVSARGSDTCAVTSDGKVRCWGDSSYGQLGDGTYTNSATPVEVAGISNATAVSTGGSNVCALTGDGKVLCWGANWSGQLGNKTNADSPTPVEVVGITNAVSIELGDSQFCARLNDGKVMCWGYNGYGQLGDGTTIDRNLPIEMGGVDNAIAISAGSQDTCVWHSDDKLRCWGDNSYGQFGDGNPYVLAPVTVMSLQ